MNLLRDFYFKEGPGIARDAPRPAGLRLLLSVVGREWRDLLKLNLLFLAASLPLVTLPAAWFASVSVTVAMVEDRNVWLWRDFWAAFRARFVAATLVGLALCAGVGLGCVAIGTYAASARANIVFAAPLAISIAASVLLPLYGAHVFVALAKGWGLAPLQILKGAAIAVLARPLPGLAALAAAALLWVIHIAFYPASVLMPVLLNFSLGALLTTFAVLPGIEFGFSRAAPDAARGRAGGSAYPRNSTWRRKCKDAIY